MISDDRARGAAAGAMRLIFWAWAAQLAIGVLMQALHAKPLDGLISWQVDNVLADALQLGVAVLEAIALARLARAPSEARAAGLAWSALGLVVMAALVSAALSALDLADEHWSNGSGMRAVEAMDRALHWGAMALELAALAQVALAARARPSLPLCLTALVLLGLAFAVTNSSLGRMIGWRAYYLIYTLLSWGAQVLLMIAIAGVERRMRHTPPAAARAATLPGR
jgi:hypothetical protein